MVKIHLSESGLNLFKRMLNEEYEDKKNIVKKFLDGKYKAGTFEEDNGDISNVFVKKVNGMPTKKSFYKDSIIDELEDRFPNIITDDSEREEFFKSVTDEWHNEDLMKTSTA